MKKFKNALIVLLISFAMSFSTWPSMGYAQFFQQENSVNENQTEDNLDNEEVNHNQLMKNKIEKIIMKMKQKVHP